MTRSRIEKKQQKIIEHSIATSEVAEDLPHLASLKTEKNTFKAKLDEFKAIEDDSNEVGEVGELSIVEDISTLKLQ